MENFFKTSNSTGKKKVKSVSLTRITESVSYPRLVQTETKKKGYEGAKPVKIAELLGLEYSKRFQKESVKPKIQPERLGKRSSQQKKEKHEADRPDQPTATGRSVRRNLNFNEMCGNAQHNNNENFNMSKKVAVVKSASKKYPYNCSRKTLLLQSNTVEEKCLEEYNEKTKIRTSRIDSNSTKDINSQIRLNVIKENGNIQKNNNENNATKKVTALRSASKKHHNLNRESLLVQPNTVKDKYMSKCNAGMKRSKKFNVSQIDTNSKENLNSQNYPNAKRHTEKSKIVQSIAPTIMVTANTPIRESCLPMEHAKSSNEIRNIEFSEVSNVTKVNNVKTSQQANNTTVQLARENDTFPKIPVMSRKTLHDAEKEECIASENQEIQLSVQNEYKNQTPISTSSTMISVNREEIVNLECNLKHYICTVEENLSNLKSTLAYVTKLLSLEDAEKVRSNVGSENIREADLAPTIAKKVMVEKAVQVEEEKNDSVEPASPGSKTESAKGLEMTRSTPKTADNKENIEDGRAKQPCTKIYTGDDSFIELENQLDITHAENVAAKIIRRTPIIKKRETIGCERTLREYLLLKSNMNFLETPDIKKYRSRLNKTSNIDEHAALSKRFISSKILKDLQNLYSESPEC